jgi:hypothetical protein
MPAEDRDRLFEKALAQHLRSDAVAAGDSACRDAETLAAYHERLLSPEEMGAAKNHLVFCARCQEILAQLEATQDAHELQNREGALIAAGAASRAIKVTQFPAAKNSLLRWAAPAGAIAAGLLLLIGIRGYRWQPKPAEPATQMAENRSDAPGTPQFAPAVPPTIEKQKSETFARQELKEQSAAPPPAEFRDPMRTSRPLERSRADSNADKKFPAHAPSAPPRSASGAAESGNRTSALAAGKFSAKNEPADRVSKSEALDLQQTGANVASNESQLMITGGAAAAPPPPAPSSAKVAATAQTVTVEAAAAAPLLKDADQPAMQRKTISDLAALPVLATAPDGKSVWRFGERGGIAHSRDSGRTWQSQFAPLTATLTSGSAPSGKICWIAGTAGTLLRTSDGGKHWQLVTTPISADLGGVHATDAKHASIWDLAIRQTYETSDGGATWKLLASK